METDGPHWILGAVYGVAYAALFAWILLAPVITRSGRLRLASELHARPAATIGGLALAALMLYGLLTLLRLAITA